MLRKKLHFFILFIVLATSVLPSLGVGYVNIRNFRKNAYSGGTQNWAVTQDSVGRMYFGNRDGMLIFDGARWKKCYLPNYTTVRALMFDDESNRIYAAGSEEFGYFIPDKDNGALKYTSLLDNMPKNRPGFTEVWHIYKDGDRVWFQTDNQMLCFTDGYIRIFPVGGRISTSAIIGSTVYVGLDDGRILQLKNGRFHNLQEEDLLQGKRITTILPLGYTGNLLIGTSVDGLYVFDGKNLKPYDFSDEVNRFLRQNQLFCATRKGDIYVFGTVNLGALTVNMATGDIQYLNKETGLQNNTVLNMGFDNALNLWMCLDNGIDYAILNSPTTNLIGRNNSIGAGYTSLLKDEKMIFGTNQGLFSTAYPFEPGPYPPKAHRLLQGQIWSVTDGPHGVFVASDAGIYVYHSDQNYDKVRNITGAYKVVTIPGTDNMAIASTYDAFHILRWDGKTWNDNGMVSGYNDINGNFIIDDDGSVWLPHWRKGVYRLRLDINNGKFYDTRLYDTSDGFPSNQNNNVALFDGHVVFATQGGIYRFNEHKEPNVVPYTELNRALNGQPPGQFQSLIDGSLAFINQNGIFIATKRSDDRIMVNHTSMGQGNNEIIPGFVHINYVSPDEMIVSTQDGFTCINRLNPIQPSWRPEPFIGAIFANRDSLIYSVPVSQKHIVQPSIELPFDLNSLRFEFAFPVYDYGERVEYSSYLENFENEWSPYSAEPYREYTRLDEGDYTMHLRVRDTKTGKIRSANIGISIKAPWFRSTAAKTVYYLLGAFLLYAIYGLARNRLANARKQMERRKDREMQELRKQNEEASIIKDYEIASLKNEQLEQDIQHKSRELSNTTMSLIHLNEVLTELSAQISNISQIATAENPRSAIIKPLAKIKDSIEHILADDKNSNTFYKNFDVVYGDYTKRLLERFPNLTTSEKRLCCYIRMGLSSKEIAPLINISAKSVEMARYRLRKKLNLGADTTLTDFLTSF